MRRTRSATGGWVQNSRPSPEDRNGPTIMRWPAAASGPLALSGCAVVPSSILHSARASASGSPVSRSRALRVESHPWSLAIRDCVHEVEDRSVLVHQAVEFGSHTNWLYTLERTTSFQSWCPASTTLSGTGASLILHDASAPTEKAFYRVSARRP